MGCPALDKARAFLATKTAEHRKRGARRLPTVHALAVQCGVSHVTMLKAVRELRDRGVLTARHGQGIMLAFSGGAAGPSVPAPAHELPVGGAPVSRWQTVSEQIRRDILSGRYGPGALLGPAKDMQHRYGACYRTLRRALHALVESRELAPYLRGYRVRDLSARSTHAAIVLIGRATEYSEDLDIHSERYGQCVQLLEQECARLGIGLRIVPVQYRGTRLTPVGPHARTLLSADTPRDVLGFVVFPTAIAAESLSELLDQLSRRGRAVALLDESGDLPAPERSPLKGALARFPVGYDGTGADEIARHLLQLGHRHIAYISPFHGSLFSRARLELLETTFSAAGSDCTVTPYTYDTVSSAWNLADEFAGTRVELEAMLDKARCGDVLRDRALAVLKGQVGRALVQESLQARVAPLFDQALALRKATAWVVVSDVVAVAALRALSERRIDVPGRISVASFDDEAGAFLAGLTSYNFNVPGLVRRMVGHILGPAAARRADRTQVLRTEGFLSRRRSTGPVRER